MNQLSFFRLCIILYSFTCISGLYTDIYKIIESRACVRLLGKDGTIGCSTPEGGTVGDLFILRTEAELNNFITSPPSESKAIAFPSTYFTGEVMHKLRATGKLKGILLFFTPPTSTGWSPGAPIPNSQWGLSDNFVWNPSGDSLNFENIPFPIYGLPAEQSAEILKLDTSDSSYPRHAVQFSTFMSGIRDAKTCLRREQCIPLGGKSVWSSFGEVGSKPIILVMANMDSNSLLHDWATGAESTASGIIGLLGSALALQNVSNAFVNDIVFAFWAGESWGYLGSRKFVADIQNFTCKENDTAPNTCAKPYKPDLAFEKIDLDNVIAAIELNQIGLPGTPPTLYIHQQNSAADNIADLLLQVSQDRALPTQFKKATTPLPPSSMMTFLQTKPDIPAIVISDHDGVYTNKNFHSHMDNGAFVPLSTSSLCDTATILAQALYLLATNQSTLPADVQIETPCRTVSTLTTCLSANFSCDFITQYLPYQRDPVPTYYTGVFGWSIYQQIASPASVFIHDYMFDITASNRSIADCSKCSIGQWCIKGVCLSSETHYHDAISLAFEWDYSNWKWLVVDETQPMWVESNWDTTGIQLFLRDSPTSEALFLTAGLVEFVGSLVAVFYARRYFLNNYKIF